MKNRFRLSSHSLASKNNNLLVGPIVLMIFALLFVIFAIAFFLWSY